MLAWIFALIALILAVAHFDFRADPTTDTGRRVVEIGRVVMEDFRCGFDWAFNPEEKRDPVCLNR